MDAKNAKVMTWNAMSWIAKMREGLCFYKHSLGGSKLWDEYGMKNRILEFDPTCMKWMEMGKGESINE